MQGRGPERKSVDLRRREAAGRLLYFLDELATRSLAAFASPKFAFHLYMFSIQLEALSIFLYVNVFTTTYFSAFGPALYCFLAPWCS